METKNQEAEIPKEIPTGFKVLQEGQGKILYHVREEAKKDESKEVVVSS